MISSSGPPWAFMRTGPMADGFPLLLANLPETIPAKFVDQQCGSAMAGIHIGFLEIAGGFADTVLVGGMEHMTRNYGANLRAKEGAMSPNPRFLNDESMKHWDYKTLSNMGFTAEKLFTQRDFTREDMDRWGTRSHNLAEKAQKEGFFKDEIMPIEAEQADGSMMVVDRDMAVLRGATFESTHKLKPAFKEDGVITAGNSSPLNAAATSMILMSKEKARAKGLKPMATIRSIGFAGVDPTIMGVGPVPASRRALKAAGMEAKDIDYWEINEAFCIVALNCIKELGLDPDRVNVMGGGTAIGHPLGATGNRLVGTLATNSQAERRPVWLRQRLLRRWTGGCHHHRTGRLRLVGTARCLTSLSIAGLIPDARSFLWK